MLPEMQVVPLSFLIAMLVLASTVHDAVAQGGGASANRDSYGRGDLGGSRLVVPPTASGAPYKGLALDWWRWALTPLNPTYNETKSCTGQQIYRFGNGKRVFFLAGTGFSPDTNESKPNTVTVNIKRSTGCNVPKDSYLFLPAVNSLSVGINDILKNGTPTSNITEYLLDENVTSTLETFSLEVDRKPVTKDSYRILSRLEPFVAAGQELDVPAAQTLGKWVLLRPLSAGVHILRFCSGIDLEPDSPGLFTFCISYILNIRGYY